MSRNAVGSENRKTYVVSKNSSEKRFVKIQPYGSGFVKILEGDVKEGEILKELTPQKTMEIISKLMTIFEVAELKPGDLKNAAEMCLADYEDAVQMCCAKRIKANYIVTRNVRDFKESVVPAFKPGELLDRI